MTGSLYEHSYAINSRSPILTAGVLSKNVLCALMQKNERIILITLAAINFTNIMDFMIMMPLGPQLMRLFNITPQQFGLVVSAYTFSAGVSGFLSAFFVDRFDRKSFLRFLYTGFLVGTLACGLAPTYELLLAARVFTGLFGGVLGALILSIVGDLIPFERRGSAMGTIMAAFSAASVFGVPFGLYIAHLLDWHAPFIFLAICGLPIMFLIWKYIPSITAHVHNKADRPNPLKILQAITSNKNQRKAITLMIILMFGHFSVVPFLSPYMVSNVGFEESQLSYIYAVGGAFTIFSSPLIGKWADKYGKLKVFTIFICLCTLPLFFITNMPHVPIWIALIATSGFFVFSGGRFIPAQAMVTATVNPQTRGSFMSITSSLQQLASGAAAYIAGMIIVKQPNGELLNYNWVGYMSIAATLICLFLARRIRTATGERF
jgi:DHA1 family inner membrane transport protein